MNHLMVKQSEKGFQVQLTERFIHMDPHKPWPVYWNKSEKKRMPCCEKQKRRRGKEKPGVLLTSPWTWRRTPPPPLHSLTPAEKEWKADNYWNIALYGDEAEVACDCYATCCWISKVAQKEPEYQFHTDMSSNTDSLLVSVTPKETIVWFGAQQPVGLATTWRPNVNKSSGEIIHLYSFIYLILYFRRRGHEQIWL